MSQYFKIIRCAYRRSVTTLVRPLRDLGKFITNTALSITGKTFKAIFRPRQDRGVPGVIRRYYVGKIRDRSPRYSDYCSAKAKPIEFSSDRRAVRVRLFPDNSH